MTLQELKQSIKQELYPRYCPNLLCQKIWYGEKGKEIYCPRCGTKGKDAGEMRSMIGRGER